ncbi:DEAD DEAH box helicase family protein [Lactobacillus selangorensis]|uniref:DEAD DEAH box helicase family protein n=1 Tax=Lactobacillus selangorensis TaxID=81857 RepID=A0A0R2FPP8_9LACO|nr:DEAD/DEAH box helicase [Lactobacillus selangorensis]KRN28325.1 DEAD DEAH box helicase family protein [Lactobacillus selangorensis]KRN31827.1 DEAD DEAH box helicase family protein [Lactobacillus selangorensis]
MKVAAPFQEYWQQQGFTQFSPIQEAVYEPLKNGQSVLGLAPTGSGKTLAFALPLLETITPKAGLQVLILAPSQELAIQLRDVIQPYAKLVGITLQSVTGKANRKRQLEKLKAKPEMIIATSGRLIELVAQKKIKLNQLKTIVVDEADAVLADDRMENVREIVDLVPHFPQLAFFSATESQLLQELPKWFGKDIQVIDVRSIDHTQGQVRHELIQVSNVRKPTVLRQLAHQKGMRALVFFNQESALQKTAATLKHHNVSFAMLVSHSRQVERQAALREFRQGKVALLLATDVAARGLDIANLPTVINYDLPQKLTTYIHRVGRTGRMGANGEVINLGDDHDKRDLQHLLGDQYQLIKVTAPHTTEMTQPKKQTDEHAAAPKTVPTKKKHKKNRKRAQKNKGKHK